MKALARRALERLLGRFDYRLADRRADPTGLAGACLRLKEQGFSPATVIDVGVGRGTPWLYAAFPEARFELFEPLESFRPAIDAAMQGLNAAVHFCALGPKPGSLTIQVNVGTPTSSSMARFDDRYNLASYGNGPWPQIEERKVDVRRLDDFGPFAGPTLLKLDVEGFESAVLEGARRTLDAVDVIISEVSVTRRTRAEPTFGGYLCLLESLGYSMVNIAEIAPFNRGSAIAYLDAVFVRSESPLRYGDLPPVAP